MSKSTVAGYKDHSERTAAEPRDEGLHDVVISKIDLSVPNINIVRLSTPAGEPPIRFLAGQWLDVFTPASSKPGGFTITSAPRAALPSGEELTPGYVELAVQSSSTNPPAAYFHQDGKQILNRTIQVRVGGSFTWPHHPPTTDTEHVRRYVFVAGGVGLNPLMSMLSCLNGDEEVAGRFITLLYSAKCPPMVKGDDEEGEAEEGQQELDGGAVLFLDRLAKIFVEGSGSVFGEPNADGLSEKSSLRLFLTGCKTGEDGKVVGDRWSGRIAMNDSEVPFIPRRMKPDDLLEALGPIEERNSTVVYVCATPDMTDQFVALAKAAEGIREENVLSEKWW